MPRSNNAAEPDDARPTEGVLARAVRVLEVLARAERPLSVRAAGAAASLSKSAAQRLLVDLVAVDLATQDPVTRHYRLGPRALALGMAYQRKVDVRRAAYAHMVALRNTTAETVGVSVSLGDQLLHVDQVESEQALTARLEIGRPLPLWSGAPARVLLAVRSDHDIAQIARNRRHAEVEPVNPPSPDELIADVEAVRLAGHARAFGETLPGVHTMSVPVRGAHGELVAVLSVTAPAIRLPAPRMDELLPQLMHAARAVSADLGWEGPIDLAAQR